MVGVLFGTLLIGVVLSLAYAYDKTHEDEHKKEDCFGKRNDFSVKLKCSGQLLQHTPVIPSRGTMKQEDQHDFKANLSYSETLSQKPTNQQKAKR